MGRRVTVAIFPLAFVAIVGVAWWLGYAHAEPNKPLESYAFSATFMALVFVGLTAVAALYQLRENRDVARADLLLRIADMFQPYHDLHVLLNEFGSWRSRFEGPRTQDQWVRVEGYMGVFQRLEFLCRRGVVDLEWVKDAYGYRMQNIVINDAIYAGTLLRDREAWKTLIEFWGRLYPGSTIEMYREDHGRGFCYFVPAPLWRTSAQFEEHGVRSSSAATSFDGHRDETGRIGPAM